MVAAVDSPDGASTFPHATVRSAQFLNAQAEANAFAFAHPTSRIQLVEREDGLSKAAQQVRNSIKKLLGMREP
jgi:hypothetical protein